MHCYKYSLRLLHLTASAGRCTDSQVLGVVTRTIPSSPGKKGGGEIATMLLTVDFVRASKITENSGAASLSGCKRNADDACAAFCWTCLITGTALW